LASGALGGGALGGGDVAALPLIVTMADLVDPKDAPSEPAIATATVFEPVNGAALLIGMTNDLGPCRCFAS